MSLSSLSPSSSHSLSFSLSLSLPRHLSFFFLSLVISLFRSLSLSISISLLCLFLFYQIFPLSVHYFYSETSTLISSSHIPFSQFLSYHLLIYLITWYYPFRLSTSSVSFIHSIYPVSLPHPSSSLSTRFAEYDILHSLSPSAWPQPDPYLRPSTPTPFSRWTVHVK